jgi:DNA-binding IclR family transcriptional regulator
MSMYEHQLQVLTILSKNLQNPQPQTVPTVSIAGEMEIQMPRLRLVLSTMNAMGLIQTDSDLQYNLITRKGLNYLG